MISLNSPVTLILTLGALAEITAATFLGPWITAGFFASPGHLFLLNPLDYLRSVSYIFGHASWDHCMGNLMFILILGPLLEEKYGSMALATMIFITAFATSLICCFLGLSLVGASGIVFMFIVMSSFGRSQGFRVPLTMIMVTFLYLGREVLAGFEPNPLRISHFGHLMGGGFGLIYGLIYNWLPADQHDAGPIKMERMGEIKKPEMSDIR